MKGAAGKAPAIQWYTADWLRDKQLQRSSPSTRGIWMNLLMFMADCTSSDCKPGELNELTVRELCQLGGCLPDEADRFIEEALRHKFCDIRVDTDGTVSVMSRRLSRDDEQRRKWRERKRKQRSEGEPELPVQGNVPPVSNRSPTVSSTSSSTSSKEKDKRSAAGASAPTRKKKAKPDSKHYAQAVSGGSGLVGSIDNACQESSQLKFSTNSPWNPWQWVQYQSNQNMHPQAILDALLQTNKYHSSITLGPWAYANTIIKTLSQNYRESDYVAEARAFAKDMERAGGSIRKLRELASTIGK